MSNLNFWDIGFAPPAIDKSLIDSLTKAATDITTSGVQQAVTAVEQTVAGNAATPIGGAAVQDAAVAAAKQATQAVLPAIEEALQKTLIVRAQAELATVLTKIQGGDVPSVPTPEDFTKADSRSRAFRTLATGLILSVIWGVLNVATVAAGLDWHNPGAKSQVAVMVATSVVGSVAAYVERALKEPDHVTQATIIAPSQ